MRKYSDMLKAERQADILQLINDNGYIESDKLIKRLGVSHVTIRRDLLALSNQNLIRLEHGGATRIDFLEGIAEPLYDTKVFVHSAEKSAIAESAAGMVNNGDILVLDSGTTNLKIAQKLRSRKFTSLTVITSDIMVAKELSSHPNIVINMLGGILRKSYFNVYGPFTELVLSKLKADKLFIGFDGAMLGRGLSLNLLEEVPIKQKMIEICDEIVAVGDSSKYGINAPYHICNWENLTHVIVDESIADEYKDYLTQSDLNISYSIVPAGEKV